MFEIFRTVGKEIIEIFVFLNNMMFLYFDS